MEYDKCPVEFKPKDQYKKLIVCMIEFLENTTDSLYRFLEDNDISLETYLAFRGNYIE